MEKNKNYDLNIIQDKYGEKFAMFCDKYFSNILDEKGKLSSFILSKFAPNRHLYQDIIDNNQIEEFIDYVLSYFTKDIEYNDTGKTVKELLSEAGYDFYECHSEEDIQKFKSLYAKGEELCTFNGGRLNKKIVFWIVRKDVDKIKREYFTNPKREDVYGTSVMSIQFTRGFINRTEIISRYNESIGINDFLAERYNPNNTYNGDLEKIIPGLTKAFEKEYDLHINRVTKEEQEKIKKRLNLPKYVMTIDGKYYRYNYKINDMYFCSKDRKNKKNIIIKDGNALELDSERYIIIDSFILDKKEKKLYPYINKNIKIPEKDITKDSFIEKFNSIKRIDEKINKQNYHKEITITLDNNDKVIIELNEEGKMIKLIDNYIKELRDNYLIYNKDLEYLECNNATKIGNMVFYSNKNMKIINMPKVKIIGHHFLSENERLRVLNTPKVEVIGSNVLPNNKNLLVANFPNLVKAGICFLHMNENLLVLNTPKLVSTAHLFASRCNKLKVIVAPNLKEEDLNIILNNNPQAKVITNEEKTIKRRR